MKVTEKIFGHLNNGKEVKLFTFESAKGLSISISNYGGIITSILMPDICGTIKEICAGFDSLEEYLDEHPHFGVIVGRYANRIAKGRFTINDKEYELPINNGANHLHGGNNGFHTKLWDYRIEREDNIASLVLHYQSKHLEEGYPGNLDITVTYRVTDDNALHINFSAKTDKPTHINLTSHGYFNLSGFDDNIMNHKLMINADRYLETDESLIPTGTLLECDNTPLYFRQFRRLGDSILPTSGGIDHCFELLNNGSIDSLAAILKHKPSGRSISVYTTQPGLQLYTGNSLDGSIKGHNGTIYNKQDAVCLETQHFPDTPNQSNFPSTLLKPMEEYRHEVKYVFKTEP